MPQLIARFLPFSVLLGTLITFAGLNQNSEIVAMKAAGISAHQILAPLILASLGHRRRRCSPSRSAWSSRRPRGQRLERVDYGPVPPDSGVLSNVWLLNGDDLILAGRRRPGAATLMPPASRSTTATGGIMQR